MAFDPNQNNPDLVWAPGADRPSNEYAGWHWDAGMGMYVADTTDPNVNNPDVTFDPGGTAPSSPDPAGYHWDPNMARYVPNDVAPAPAPEAPSGGGGGGGYTPPPETPAYTPPAPSSGGGYTPPSYSPPPPSQSATDIAGNPPTFNAPAYTPPPAFSYGDFTSPVDKPGAFSYADFTAPTAEDVYKDPSYQLRFQQGQNAIENSASARGVLGTGGTIKDFINYGQNFASQEYGNVYGRQQQDYLTNLGNAYNTYKTNYQTQYADPYNEAMQTYGANRANAIANYNTNYQTQYTDPFQMAFANAQAELQPQELAYTSKIGAAQHATDAATASAQHDADQAALYGFNNKVFDANYGLQTQQSNFDEWYRKFLLQLQASQ
jgi:hypothetical protein